MQGMSFLIELREYAFLPTQLSWVYPGDSLLFWNSGNEVHQLNYEGTESPELLPGMFWQFSLDEEKDYKFTCSKHEGENLVVHVRPIPETSEEL